MPRKIRLPSDEARAKEKKARIALYKKDIELTKTQKQIFTAAYKIWNGLSFTVADVCSTSSKTIKACEQSASDMYKETRDELKKFATLRQHGGLQLMKEEGDPQSFRSNTKHYIITAYPNDFDLLYGMFEEDKKRLLGLQKKTPQFKITADLTAKSFLFT